MTDESGWLPDAHAQRIIDEAKRIVADYMRDRITAPVVKVHRPPEGARFDPATKTIHCTVTMPGGTYTAEQASEILAGDRAHKVELLLCAFWLAHGGPALCMREYDGRQCWHCERDYSNDAVAPKDAKERADSFRFLTDIPPERCMDSVGLLNGTLGVWFEQKPEAW